MESSGLTTVVFGAITLAARRVDEPGQTAPATAWSAEPIRSARVSGMAGDAGRNNRQTKLCRIQHCQLNPLAAATETANRFPGLWAAGRKANHLIHGGEAQIAQRRAGCGAAEQGWRHHSGRFLHAACSDGGRRQLRAAFPQHPVAAALGQGSSKAAGSQARAPAAPPQLIQLLFGF